jgi:hypothetical protein
VFDISSGINFIPKPMKKFYLLLFVLTHIFSNLSAQKPGKEYLKMKETKEFILFPGNEIIAPVNISLKPVTNREYIIYLLWLSKVYISYPEVLYNAIPGLKQAGVEEVFVNDLNYLKEKTEREIKDYLFNAKYIDYPVIGLTWFQASLFCRWLSDRYNENLLISNKLTGDDYYQIDDNCFTTETFLSGRYVGIIDHPIVDPVTKDGRPPLWEDKILFPSFRLPSVKETAACQKETTPELKPYPMFSFLRYRHKSFYRNDSLVINFYFEDPSEIPLKLTSDQNASVPAVSGEWFLDSNLDKSGSAIPDIFNQLGQKELDYKNIQFPRDSTGQTDYMSSDLIKDKTGHMPFLLIGETTEGRPVIVKNYVNPNGDGNSIEKGRNIFRVAVSAIKAKK